MSKLNYPLPPILNQTMPKWESRRKRQEEVRGCKRKYEMLEEGKGPRVPRSQGPRYLKVTFKYELDSKEGLSC